MHSPNLLNNYNCIFKSILQKNIYIIKFCFIINIQKTINYSL